jgi:hypothetical protein
MTIVSGARSGLPGTTRAERSPRHLTFAEPSFLARKVDNLTLVAELVKIAAILSIHI